MDQLIITPKKNQGNSSVVSARLPDEIIEKLDQLSANTGRSRNELLIAMIEFSLDKVVIDEE